ncbi:MAG: hypothetical protein RI907_613 [Pseudomonadota bacterium]|jgi:AcrR family transcriptional regulator
METPRRYAGATAEARKAERYERLIDAAFDVFGREGVRKATMRLICAQARLTERYFYEHFNNLEEVFQAVHRRTSSQAGAAVMAALTGAPKDAIGQTRAGLRAFFEFIQADSRRAQILLLDAAASGLTAPNEMNRQLSLLSTIVQSRIQARYPKITQYPEYELIITGIAGMIIHTSTLWVSREFDWPVEKMVDHNIYAWHGLHQWLAALNQAEAPQGAPTQSA